MSTTVREFTTDTMRRFGLSSYVRDAEPVLTALEERDADIATSLVAFATDNGLSEGAAEALMVEVGLARPRPQAVASNGQGDTEIPAWFRPFADFARRHGFPG